MFLAARARRLGLGNVHAVCTGDATPLPFPPATFDSVVLNGLDWFRPMDRAAQLGFLREIRRLLKEQRQLRIRQQP